MKGYVIPNTLAVTTAIIFVVCRVLVGLFPDASFTVAQSWFHGMAVTQISAEALTLSSLILGLISSAVSAWIIGWIFMRVYKMLSK